jgi:hypothetical protein
VIDANCGKLAVIAYAKNLRGGKVFGRAALNLGAIVIVKRFPKLSL